MGFLPGEIFVFSRQLRGCQLQRKVVAILEVLLEVDRLNVECGESMGTYGNLREPMGIYGNLWEPKGTYGNLWESMETLGIYGESMVGSGICS